MQADSPPVHRVRRSPLGRQIATAIRDDILFGQLAPGTHLTQQDLCERYGTSRMPVRDALRELTHSGLIVSDDSGRSVVAPMSRRRLRDTYRIQGMLHGLATRMVAEEATDAQIEELEDLHEQMLAAEKAADPELMADLNFLFHRRINHIAASPPLLAVIRILADQIPPHYATKMPQWMERANREHGRVMGAVRARDGEEASGLMEGHVTDAVEDLIAYLEQAGVEFSES
jgi:DNA-binding GntR family transcriptional regulator